MTTLKRWTGAEWEYVNTGTPAGTSGTTVVTVSDNYTAANGDLVLADATTCTRSVTDAVLTGGVATLDSASAAFTTADLGRYVNDEAWDSVLDFGSTIEARVSATQATLSRAATADDTDDIVFIFGLVVTLPAPVAGGRVEVAKTDATAVPVIVRGASGNVAHLNFGSVALVSDGATWTRLAGSVGDQVSLSASGINPVLSTYTALVFNPSFTHWIGGPDFALSGDGLTVTALRAGQFAVELNMEHTNTVDGACELQVEHTGNKDFGIDYKIPPAPDQNFGTQRSAPFTCRPGDTLGVHVKVLPGAGTWRVVSAKLRLTRLA